MTTINSEMTASVWRILVEDGATVSAGQEIMTLESMKMEFPVEAPTAGTCRVLVAEGQSVIQGAPLAEITEG